MDKRVEEEFCCGCSSYSECKEKELWDNCDGYKRLLRIMYGNSNKSTDDMKNFETGAVRDTGGKGRCDLLPMCSLLRVSKHMEDSLTHYPERNWEKGLPMHTMVDSALRHLMKYVDGWDDEDHLCAAATNILMAMWTEEKRPDMQDIPARSKSKETARLGGVFAKGLATGIMSALNGDITFNMGPAGVRDISKVCNCDCYDDGKCMGTKEIDSCNCDGDLGKCDFYPKKRKSDE